MTNTETRGPGQIHCSQCGKVNTVNYDNTAYGKKDALGIDPCSHCGGRLVDVIALLIELGFANYEYRACPGCDRANRTDPYCYACGLCFKDHGWER